MTANGQNFGVTQELPREIEARIRAEFRSLCDLPVMLKSFPGDGNCRLFAAGSC